MRKRRVGGGLKKEKGGGLDTLHAEQSYLKCYHRMNVSNLVYSSNHPEIR